ncbi:unnamed protein product [Bathycoccus prasinos]
METPLSQPASQEKEKIEQREYRERFIQEVLTESPATRVLDETSHTGLDLSKVTLRKCSGFDGSGRLEFESESTLGSTLGDLDKEAAVTDLRKFSRGEGKGCKASGLAIIENIVESLFALFKEKSFLLFLGCLVGFCEEAHVTHFHTYSRETDALAAESKQFRDGRNWAAWLEGFSSNLFGVRFLKKNMLYLRHCLTRKIGDGFAQLWGDKVLTRHVNVAAYADNAGKSESEDCVHPTNYEAMARKVFEYYLDMEHKAITDMNCLFGHSLVKPFIEACLESSGIEVYKLVSRTTKGEDLHEAHDKEGIYVVVRDIEGKDGKYKRVFYWFVAVCQPSAISKSNSYGASSASSMSTRALDIANVILKLLDWQWWPKHFNPFHISLGPVAPLPEPFLHPRPNTFNATLQFVRAPSDEDLEAEEVRVAQELFGLGDSAVIPFESDETDFDYSNDVRE